MLQEDFQILTYRQALELVIPHISKLIDSRKLKNFCLDHNLNYRVVVMMNSGSSKEYPDVLHDLLEIFDYKTEREKAFKVFNM